MTMSTVGRIKLVNPANDQVARGNDGLFRNTTGAELDPDASVHLVSGTLESSNVNIAETMANMIELARSYEVQVKAMKTAEDTAASSSKLLQSS
jgi:flagellar basal-body rod protein FlgF